MQAVDTRLPLLHPTSQERGFVPPYTKIKAKEKEWFIGTQCGYEEIYAALNLMTVQLRRLDGKLFNQNTVFEHHLL